MAQGYIWGVGGMIGALCSSALAGFGLAIYSGVVGFITGVIAQAPSYWRYFTYRVVEFAYGCHWTWWGGYPYFYHSSTWGW